MYFHVSTLTVDMDKCPWMYDMDVNIALGFGDVSIHCQGTQQVMHWIDSRAPNLLCSQPCDEFVLGGCSYQAA